jgi:hypothetical protein
MNEDDAFLDPASEEIPILQMHGIGYPFCGLSIERYGGAGDGIKFFMVINQNQERVWVREDQPGEFVQLMVPTTDHSVIQKYLQV